MKCRREAILINRSIQHNYNSINSFRLHNNYVNHSNILYYIILLQNLNLNGTAGDDVITAFVASL